ncbi:unnamed protein product, partial [marine sediment metagenome]
IELEEKRKRAEESLREKTAYLDQLFESAQEGIVVSDSKGKVIRANKEFYKLFRYTHNDVIGKSLDELVSSKDFYTKARSITLDVAKGKKVSFENMRQRKDKKIIDVSVLASPIMIFFSLQATGICPFFSFIISVDFLSPTYSMISWLQKKIIKNFYCCQHPCTIYHSLILRQYGSSAVYQYSPFPILLSLIDSLSTVRAEYKIRA